MTRTRRPRSSRALAVTAGAVVLIGAVLTGCGTGQLAQTSKQMSAENGAGTQVAGGAVQIRNAQIPHPQRLAAPGVYYQRGGAAPLLVTIVNTVATPDRLVRVSTPIATNVTIAGDPTLPQNVALAAGGVSGTPTPNGNRSFFLTLTGLTGPVRSGMTVPVTFTFERAGSSTFGVPTSPPAEGVNEPERADSEAAGGEQPAPPVSEAAPAPTIPRATPVAPGGGVPAPAPAPAPEGGR